MVKVNPGSSFETKKKSKTGHGWYKFWPHFKAFIILIILYQFQKDPFCLIILYDILFYFIYIYKAPGQEETPLGDNFLMQAERSYYFDHGCMLQKKKKTALPSDFMHIFHDFIHVHSPWAGADNPLGPNILCQQDSLITRIICCKFKKNLRNLWLYTHLFMI